MGSLQPTEVRSWLEISPSTALFSFSNVFGKWCWTLVEEVGPMSLYTEFYLWMASLRLQWQHRPFQKKSVLQT